MYLYHFSETADAEVHCERHTRSSMYVWPLNDTARLCHSLTEMQNMRGFIFKVFFAA